MGETWWIYGPGVWLRRGWTYRQRRAHFSWAWTRRSLSAPYRRLWHFLGRVWREDADHRVWYITWCLQCLHPRLIPLAHELRKAYIEDVRLSERPSRWAHWFARGLISTAHPIFAVHRREVGIVNTGWHTVKPQPPPDQPGTVDWRPVLAAAAMLVCLLAPEATAEVSLAAFPTIVFDSGSGNNANSGAGPATPITGTSGSTNAGGTVVTLDGTPDLSGVTVDVDVIYISNISSGRKFGRITAVDDGADTVTVDIAFLGSQSSLTWAIGGDRASIDAADSRLLIANGGQGDLRGGWAMELADGHSEAFGTAWDINAATDGDTTNGAIILRGKSGAGTLPKIQINANVDGFVPRGDYWVFRDFEIEKITTNGVRGIVGVGNAGFAIWGLKMVGTGGFTWTAGAIIGVNEPGWTIRDCEITAAAIGSSQGQSTSVVGNYIHDCSADGVDTSNNLTGFLVYGNLIVDCVIGADINQTRTDVFAAVLIIHNTVHSCSGDGVEYTGDSETVGAFTFMNNICSNNGAYGLDMGTFTSEKLLARGFRAFNNCFFTNTSGTTNPSDLATDGVSIDEITTDPTYTASGSDDFSVGTNMKAKGYPLPANLIGFSTTESHVDIGAAQREEPAGGGGTGDRFF